MGRSSWNSDGFSNFLGSRLAAPCSRNTWLPAGISVPPTSVGTLASLKSPLTTLSMRRVSSMKFGMSPGSARSLAWTAGSSARILNALERKRVLDSWPAAKMIAAMRTTSMTSGREPSLNVAVASPVSTSSRGSRRRSSTYVANFS